jgi:hypothetical protein
MKTLTLLCAVLLPTATIADTYVEYKHKRSLDVSGKTSQFVRIGHKFENNFYLEVGKDSAETGYKKKFGNFVMKGKVESTNNFDKNGLEVEARYTFK